MDLELLKKPLEANEIDFRIQSINKGGYATILAYKDARVDMNRLDNSVGALNWKREHVNNNANCIISIWDEDKKQWVSKEDTGTESFTEKAKGLASDSFKRAGFNWGIGRELYDYPLIQVKLNANEFEIKKDNKNQDRAYATWNLKLKDWIWSSKFEDNKMIELTSIDQNSKSRFTWKNGEIKKPEVGLKTLSAKAYKEVLSADKVTIEKYLDTDGMKKAGFELNNTQIAELTARLAVLKAQA